MGEAKQEEAKAEPKPEEKQEEKKEEKAEEKKEEAKPSPPPPIVLLVDLHCVGCAKKIKRSILRCKGAEEVEIDMVHNKVTVRGIVDPQALCSRIQKKTMREPKILSPLPPADGDAAKPEAVVASQTSGLSTVELIVNMHCEACAQQLKRKILKMRGVQAVEIEQSNKKVTVTGTMNADRLVEYIHRRTGKLAKVIPPPPPPVEEQKKPEEAEKKPEEKPPEGKVEEKAEEKKEENVEKKEEEKVEEKKEEEKGDGNPEKPKEPEQPATNITMINDDEMAKKMAYWYSGGMHHEEDLARRTMHYVPIYVMGQPIFQPPPPPQLFSDENPNACCIS